MRKTSASQLIVYSIRSVRFLYEYIFFASSIEHFFFLRYLCICKSKIVGIREFYFSMMILNHSATARNSGEERKSKKNDHLMLWNSRITCEGNDINKWLRRISQRNRNQIAHFAFRIRQIPKWCESSNIATSHQAVSTCVWEKETSDPVLNETEKKATATNLNFNATAATLCGTKV